MNAAREFRKYFEIDATRIDAVSVKDVLVQIEAWIDQRSRGHYVVAANVHAIMESVHDKRMGRALAGADLVTPDGMPLVVVARWRGFALRERTDGPRLMAAALERGLPDGWRHYFYGSTPGVLASLCAKTRERWPNIQIAGSHSPPFRALTVEENQDVVNEINAASPDILWVGLGCPKQELWMLEHKDTLRIPVMLGVGQAFDLLAGVKTHAPAWMSNLGLEWLYRLAREPRRVWKRYVIYNPEFIWLALAEEAKSRLRKSL